MKFTQKTVARELRSIGCTFNKTLHGEYRVNLRNGTEDTAYYTDDLEDALETGKAMTYSGVNS